jgi:hypothetical protein
MSVQIEGRYDRYEVWNNVLTLKVDLKLKVDEQWLKRKMETK